MVTRMGARSAAAPRRTFFRYGTRQRFAPVKTGLAFASGGRISQDFPRVGFLASVFVRLTGTMTLSAAGALGFRGPWDLVKELVLRVNIGATTVYRQTGFGNYVLQRALSRAFDPAGAWPAPFGASPDDDIEVVRTHHTGAEELQRWKREKAGAMRHCQRERCDGYHLAV